ncbi:unnamed protein product [Penicillium nalgiovense]|uniref:Uncharacterized protein n=3 Tax=Penicillium TaxID=5073 RepID=A0A9W4N1X5_9EURO|nr:unnamed protein product [Penicillium salamii]CAG7952954.1 unnamed protein product [Penicillium nalgiovense]CRL31351.1 unnamed protein product [Penicillium camemberti]CAG7937647.1 unnamed protein product [Penicillium salamii]CAG7937678.1 unnamed protein product [Penicillium salamii]
MSQDEESAISYDEPFYPPSSSPFRISSSLKSILHYSAHATHTCAPYQRNKCARSDSDWEQ